MKFWWRRADLAKSRLDSQGLEFRRGAFRISIIEWEEPDSVAGCLVSEISELIASHNPSPLSFLTSLFVFPL